MIDEAYYNPGVILGGRGKYQEALAGFEEALKIDPKYKLAKQALKEMKRVLTIKGTSNNPLNRSAR